MCIRILLIVSSCGQLRTTPDNSGQLRTTPDLQTTLGRLDRHLADHSTRPIAALTRDLRTTPGRLDMLLTAQGHSLIWVGGYRTLGSPREIVAYKHPS